MIPLVWQIWIALALDLILGDPRWMPHPVRFMGRGAMALEIPVRRLIRNPRAAGIVAALAVVLSTVLVSGGALLAARAMSPLAGDLAAIWMIYTTVAARDLWGHSRRVRAALDAGDLAGARKAASMIVGRDTDALDEAGVVRAAVESVAENTVDGVVAPLFFAFLLGPVGAMGFKAVSTLDSTFGYKNARYRWFGWASARLDDMANFIPARLGLLLLSVAAVFAGGRPGRAFAVGLRDARKHASPNAGFPEAAVAGALGVRLGGPVIRGGKQGEAPLLGDPLAPLERRHITRANTMMAGATFLAALAFTGFRTLMEGFFRVG